MVYYLSESDKDIERYAEMDTGVMGVPLESYKQQMEYAEPDKMHPRAVVRIFLSVSKAIESTPTPCRKILMGEWRQAPSRRFAGLCGFDGLP